MQLSYCQICRKPKHYCQCPDFRQLNYKLTETDFASPHYWPSITHNNKKITDDDIYNKIRQIEEKIKKEEQRMLEIYQGKY